MKKEKIIYAILSLISLFIDVNKIYVQGNKSYFTVDYIILVIVFILLLYYFNRERIVKHWSIDIFAIILSIIMLIGNSFFKQGNFSLITSNLALFILSIIIFIGYYYLIKTILKDCYTIIDRYKINSKNRDNQDSNIINNLLKRHPILIGMIFVILCWLPYIISFYPAILSPDPSYQIQQFFGIKTKYNNYSVMLDDNVTITNHHPVIHTVLLGGSLKIGRVLFNNDNMGLFMYSLIQIIFLAFTLAFTIYYMQKIKIPIRYQKISLLIYGLLPIFPLYAMSAVKDVIFSCLIIIYCILFYNILKNRNQNKLDKKNIIIYIIVMVFTFLFRNNGIHVILLSFPVLFIFDKINRKMLLFIYFLIIFLYTLYSSWLLPTLRITSGSVREILSIPFQQTARYVTQYDEEVTNEEKKIIDKVLDYDTLSERYNPEKSDPVKNEFNKYTTNSDLKEYFKIWFKQLLKHPVSYIEATINNTYGYFYPNKTSWYIYYKFDDRIVEKGFNYHYNGLNSMRNLLSSMALSLPKIPILGLSVNIAFYVWIMLFMVFYLLYRKKYIDSLFMLPSLIILLVCIASPVNVYFRYAMPFIFAMPVLIAIFMDILRKD